MRTLFKLLFWGVVGAFVVIWMLVQAGDNGAAQRASRPEEAAPTSAPDPLIAETVETLRRNEIYWAAHQPPVSPREWLVEFAEMEAAAESIRAYDGEELTHVTTRTARLLGAIDRLSPKPRAELATLNCAMAAQALLNYMHDASKGAASAADDRRDFLEWKPKCLASMGVKTASKRR